jgi:ABC-2 type transport system ATP-binding protein
VRARALVRRYGRTPALDGVDLDVRPGTIAAVTGSNGAGKTTLLRVFATLLRADEGDAWVHGHHVVRDGDLVRRSIGVALVNDRGVYWRLSARRNLQFFARALGLGKRDAAAEAARALDEMGMESFGDRPVLGYSAGQRQRLVLARASLASPPVLLVDEPMRGLDDDGIERTRAMLRRSAERGATVVVAGPAIGEFADLCSEVFVLEAGRVAERAPVAADR